MLKRNLHRVFDIGTELLTGTPSWRRRYERDVRKHDINLSLEYDIVYVMPPKSLQGWILDAICREMDQFLSQKYRTATATVDDPLPKARAYFYSHYGFFRDMALKQPSVQAAKNILFYTHPRQLWYSHREWCRTAKYADRIVSMSTHFVPTLRRDGISADKIDVGLLGADPNVFRPHARGCGTVGFCSAFHPRKAGKRILDVVRQMPETRFILCGRNWDQWDGFQQLRSLSNFEYRSIPYSEYPDFYQSIDVFVSVSELEGGPVPLIEATMCNAVPVCSRTGHAGDIITHTKNGYIFEVDAPTAEICKLIRLAQKHVGDVHATVAHLTWERFSHQIEELAGLRAESRDKPPAAATATSRR